MRFRTNNSTPAGGGGAERRTLFDRFLCLFLRPGEVPDPVEGIDLDERHGPLEDLVGAQDREHDPGRQIPHVAAQSGGGDDEAEDEE